jgi:hydroxyacyl-ACP dehydratase HTD2-like protein with hotdog domain
MATNMNPSEILFEGVAVGTELPALVKVPTTVQLFRYSAVTWNAHRIHYEKEYAIKEGHPDVLVQAHLHGAFLLQMIGDWMGLRGRLVRFGWSNRGRAIPGDTLTCTGRVIDKRVVDGQHLVDLEIVETNQRGEVCAPGQATVALPSQEARQ